MSEDPAASFSGFVISTTTAAAFRRLSDPVSGEKRPLNLEGAAQMIAILAMLDQKTRGNLTAQERSLLDQVLYDLRMRYVAALRDTGAAVPPAATS